MAAQRYYSYSFAANQQIRIHQSGLFFRVTAGAALFTVQPDSQNELQVQNGIGARYEDRFNSLVITNGATAQTITLYIGDGNVDDAGLYGSINTTITPPADWTSGDDTTVAVNAQSTIAANGDRKKITIQASINNTENLRICDAANFADDNGIELIPGSSYPLETSAAIVIHNPSTNSNTQTYRYWETHD